MKKITQLSALAAAVISITSIPMIATAAEEEIIIAPVVLETVAVTTYLNGGVGKDEQEFMHRVAKDFPLRLTFSERKDGEYILDVPVVISNEKGNPIFELPKAGPMLYVMLPSGKYKISARFKGLTETQTVNITDKAGADLYFHWQGTPAK